ncbi:hypothetical protein [Pedosphaera parvula]|uniref:PhnA-like protein n=1 Tax=Pedosphaera parvula (strain Ellin514) TaxID=320771 RepID=B9X9P1_PEDPL|nr:hypothetical protein [Pedosphaera parvula]EEF63212.1 conserved hypothetical protein [Pedosphaera parvula Ellin514]
MKEEVVYEQSVIPRQPALRRISWAAIFAGLIITLVVNLVLTILGISIGASAVSPLSQQNPGQGFGIGAAIWLIVTSLISMFCGAWVAGRMAGFAREGSLHGLVTWGTTTLLTLILMTMGIGGILSGGAKLLGQAIPGAGEAVASMQNDSGGAGGISSALQGASGGGADSIKQDIQSVSKDNTAQENAQLTVAVGKLLKSDGSDQEARQSVVNLLVSNNHMSQDEANRTVDRWVQDYQKTKGQVEQKARVVGEKTAKGVSIAGWSAFGMLVLSAIAAAAGGASGAASFARARALDTPATV